MHTLLTYFLLQLGYGILSYINHTALAKTYNGLAFSGDYGFIGLSSGSSPETFNLINGSFVEDQTISSVASGTKVAFAKQASKVIIYDSP